jgi:DNA-binding LacI/PurR family transcriptional regulator
MIFLASEGKDSTSITRNQIEQGYGFDGFVLFNTRYCTKENLEENVAELLKTEFPFVIVNSPALHFDVNQVVFTTPESSNAINFLWDQGHCRIALMLGREHSLMCREELQQFRESYRKRGVAMDENLILYGDYERPVARGAMLQFLQKEIDFSAIYCVSDTMALGVYEALKEHGLRIPEDISVVGRHDSFFSNFLNPALTTVRLKIFEGGVKAAELLLDTIQHGAKPRKIFLDNELILRSSTRVWR